MSATISAPATRQSWTQSTRAALLALAIVVLLAVSFVVGRTTVSTSHHAPSITPAGSVNTGDISCHVGRPC